MDKKNDKLEQENVFLFKFGFIVPAVLKCLFCVDVIYHWKKSYPYLLSFVPIKDCLDVYNAEHPG